MNSVFKLHVMPAKVVNDRGSTFMNAFWVVLCLVGNGVALFDRLSSGD